jgi:diguanylate cyclase
LKARLNLLAQSGRQAPPGVPGSPEWTQALIDALVELSSRDALTGLANRRAFELALAREVDRVARSGEPACCWRWTSTTSSASTTPTAIPPATR